jgi:hypothetical protein
MEIHQIVIRISFDGLSYCEYRSRISGLIGMAINTTIWYPDDHQVVVLLMLWHGSYRIIITIILKKNMKQIDDVTY